MWICENMWPCFESSAFRHKVSFVQSTPGRDCIAGTDLECWWPSGQAPGRPSIGTPLGHLIGPAGRKHEFITPVELCSPRHTHQVRATKRKRPLNALICCNSHCHGRKMHIDLQAAVPNSGSGLAAPCLTSVRCKHQCMKSRCCR